MLYKSKNLQTLNFTIRTRISTILILNNSSSRPTPKWKVLLTLILVRQIHVILFNCPNTTLPNLQALHIGSNSSMLKLLTMLTPTMVTTTITQAKGIIKPNQPIIWIKHWWTNQMKQLVEHKIHMTCNLTKICLYN